MNNTTTTTTNTADNTATATISNPNEKLYTINLVNNTKKWNIAKFSNKIDISNFTKPVKMFKYNPVAQMINNESNNFGQPTGNSYYNNYYKNNYYNNNNYNNNNNNNNAAATAGANTKNNASVIATNTATNTAATTTTTDNSATTTTTTTTTATGTTPVATAIPRKKKFEPKPVNPKTIPWKLEDSEGNNTYQGNVEGNQASSNYFLFMFQSDGSIKAVPCNDWYNFRPKKQFQSLTTEEAEDFMKKKNQEWDIFTSRLAKNTAPVTADGKKSLEDEEELKGASKQELKYFSKMNVKSSASEPDRKNKRKPTKRSREREDEGEGGEDGDAPDFESKFDDDDDDTYMDGDGLTGEDGPQIEEDEEEEEQDLTAGGLEMKKMIKKQQQKNEDGEDADDDDKKSKEGEDDDDDDDDEDPDQDDLSNLPNLVKKEDGSDSSPTTSSTKESKSSKKSKKQKDGSPKSKEKKSKKNKDGSERESKKAKKESAAAAASSSPPQPQQPQSPTQQQTNDSDPPFTQEYITRILQKSKKVKSIDLINIFKGPLKNPENKQIFLSMVHNVARVVEENGIKYLIPK